MRKVLFRNHCYYHIFNRGVEKRDIFLTERDFQRFYNSLYLFNDSNFRNPGGDSSLRDELIEIRYRDPLVNIISFCLLPNHFHLFVEQVQEKGISKFLHRIQMGYAKYFNLCYERSGRLFEGAFQAVIIDTDSHFIHLPRYIHFNILDHAGFNWREGKIFDWGKALKYLDQYPWSSHRAYMEYKQPLPVVDMTNINRLFKNSEDYLSFIRLYSKE